MTTLTVHSAVRKSGDMKKQPTPKDETPEEMLTARQIATEEWLNVKQVAALIGAGLSSVRLWARTKKFPNAKLEITDRGPVYKIPVSDLVGFQKVNTGAPLGKKRPAKKAAKK